MGRILIVSRDEGLRDRLAVSLRARSIAVDEARVVSAASARPEKIIVDVAHATAPGWAMVPLLREVTTRFPGVPVLVLAPFPSANLMHTAMRLGAAHCIERTAMAARVLEAFEAAERPIEAGVERDAFATLEEARWQHIGRALESARGNISVAAKLLGLHRQSLQRMLRSQRLATGAPEAFQMVSEGVSAAAG
jgi:two-component system response regulator RegA